MYTHHFRVSETQTQPGRSSADFSTYRCNLYACEIGVLTSKRIEDVFRMATAQQIAFWVGLKQSVYNAVPVRPGVDCSGWTGCQDVSLHDLQAHNWPATTTHLLMHKWLKPLQQKCYATLTLSQPVRLIKPRTRSRAAAVHSKQQLRHVNSSVHSV